MRKTVTTMLSLALALILVSSLGSGVILADDDDDKEKKKYTKVREVVVFVCSTDGPVLRVSSYSGPEDLNPFIELGAEEAAPPCGDFLSDLLNLKYRFK